MERRGAKRAAREAGRRPVRSLVALCLLTVLLVGLFVLAVDGGRTLWELAGDSQGVSQALWQRERELALQGGPVLGRSRGVLAWAVNKLQSGAYLADALAGLKWLTRSARAGFCLLAVLWAVGVYLLWRFAKYVYAVGRGRASARSDGGAAGGDHQGPGRGRAQWRCGIWSVVALFFACSMAGWLWEVVNAFVKTGELVNRGFCHGPWLPIYGSGACLILLVLGRFRERPGLLFVLSMALCGALEYATGLCLELVHGGQRWWEYEGYFLNFQGRICAEGLLLFAVGGFAVVYWLAPGLDALLSRAPRRLVVGVCVALLAFFVADEIWSLASPNEGPGITEEVWAGICQVEESPTDGLETPIR